MLSKRCLLPTVVVAFALAVPALAQAATPIPGQYIVTLKGGASGRTVAAEHARSAGAKVLDTYDSALHAYTAKLSDAGLAKVKADPRVASVTQDARGNPLESQMLPTGVDRIDAEVGAKAAGSNTVAPDGSTQTTVNGGIAIFDTGVDTKHPDLNVAGGVNCAGPVTQYNDGTINDQYGHGTHVAGIAGAKDDGNGVVGVAPGVRLYSVRDLDSRPTGTISMQLCGIDWITNNAAALGITVANSSQVMLTAKPDDGNCGYTNGDILHQAICRSTAAGVTWVFGDGNSTAAFTNAAGPNYQEVLSVGALSDSNGQPNVPTTKTFSCTSAIGSSAKSKPSVETDDKYATYSDWASSTVATQVAHTVMAPGSCIWSTLPGGKYGYLSGTSMAAPHATGTVELCIVSGQCAGLTPGQIIQKIRSDAATYNTNNPFYGFTGDPLHSPVSGRYYGYLLNAGLY